MNYIINVKAQLLNDGSNLKTQYSAVKRDIERQTINVKAVLDPNELSLKAIQKQLNEQKLTLNIANVEFNQSATKSSIDKTASTISNQLSKAMSTMNVTGFNKGNYSSLLKDMGLDDDFIKKATESVQKLGITITKISGTDYGTDAKGNNTISAIIQGEDKLGRIVTLSQKIKVTMDESGNELIDFSNKVINVTDNIKQQVQAQEKANKAYVQQKKLIDDATASAKEMWAAQNRNNPIKDVTNSSLPINGISSLSADYEKITPKTKEFVEAYNKWVKIIRTANDELKTQSKISSETELALRSAEKAVITLSRDITKERSTQTDFRSKDVTAEIEKAKEELKLFESKIAKVGLSLKDLAGDSGETLRDMLDNVSDSNGFAKYLDQLGIAKARFKNLEDEIKTDAKAMQDYKKSMQDLISLNEKIASQEKKIIDAEYAGKPQETIQLLKDELDDLQITYNKLVTNFMNNPLFESLVGEDLNELDKSVARIEQVAESRRAEKSQRHDEKLKKEYYQEQLKVQNEIDKLIAEQNKLSADADNIHQRELVSIVQKLKILEQQKDTLDVLAKANLSEESYLENQNQLLHAGNEKLEERKRLRSQIYDSVESKANSTYDSFAESINKEHFDKNLGSNGKSAITSDVDKINQLKNAYWEVVDALDALKSSTTNQQLKENTEAVEEAIKKYNDLASAIKNVDSIGSDLSKLKTQTDKGLFAQNSDNQKVIELKSEIQDIANEYERLNGIFKSEGMSIKLSQEFQALGNRIKNVSTDAGVLEKELQETKTAASLLDKKNTLSNKIEMWLKNNTKASESMKRSMRELQAQIESANGAKLTGLQQEFKRLKNVADATGQTGMRTLDNLNEKIGKFSSWFGVSQFIMGAVNDTKEAIVTLKEVDSILTEISKTSNMSEESLKRLGNTAFESANQYGVTVQSFLTGVQEMSRAGYQDAEGMANLSILAQAAGDMTEEVADKYLIATDAAYKLAGSQEELSKILDGQNQIKIIVPLYRNV